MKSLAILTALLLIGQISMAQTPKAKDKEAILAVMAAQEKCWNQGNLECFMKGYWEDEGLKFIGKALILVIWSFFEVKTR